MARECNSQIKCLKCNGKHHVAVCQDQNNGFSRRPHNTSGDQRSTQQTTQEANVSTSSQNPEAQPFVSTQWNMNQGTVGFYVNAHMQILLQTARAIVSRPYQSQIPVSARISFDSGSQRTFIINTLKDKLQLSILNSEQLMIKNTPL